MSIPPMNDDLRLAGTLTLFAACERPERAIIELTDRRAGYAYLEGREAFNWAPHSMLPDVERYGHLMVITEPNGFVQFGLDTVNNLLFGVNGPPSKIQCMIVASSSTAVAATDTSILGGATAPIFTFGATQNAYSATLANPAPVASSASQVTGGIQFTNSNYSNSGVWPINRMGFVNVAASTNLGLIDVIGNTAAQADPYSRTFSVDFHSAGSWTLNPQITITTIKQQSAFPTPL